MSKRVQGHMTDKNWNLLDLMEKMGQDKGGYSISQMALGWMLTDPVISSPIIGPRNMEQFTDNIGAVGLRLSDEEKAILNEASDWK